MDYNELVRDIVAQVLSQMKNKALPPAESGRQKLFVAAAHNGSRSKDFLESEKMKDRFDMVCAMSADYSCCLEGSAGIAVFGLSNADVARLESGICDTPYTALISKALVLGVPVFSVREETEILACGCQSPYARMYLAKLRALEGLGMTLCGFDELEDRLCGAAEGLPQCGAKYVCQNRVVTERDVIAARDAGARTVETLQKPIITDLARERAKKHGIEFAAR